jgi:hypothetical protein
MQIPTGCYTNTGPNDKPVFGPDTVQQSDCAPYTHRAPIDTDTEASTTHLPYLLHKFQNISYEKYMSDAGDTKHRSTGFGYLKIVTNDANGAPHRFALVHCWLTPTLRHTVFSPGATVKRHRTRFSGCMAYTNFETGCGHAALHAIASGSDVVIPGKLLRTLLYTEPLVICSPVIADDTTTPQIRYLSEPATRVLWHQCLHHVHMRHLDGLHLQVDGIPPIKLPPDVEGCDTCWSCKLRNVARGTGDTRQDATVPGQCISLDFGFIFQRSKDLS